MAIFLTNKYARVYNSIIERSKLRHLSGYTELHHIVPRSIGGSDDATNLASLTAREHFICHLLLTKMTVDEDRFKMLSALRAMALMSPRGNDERARATSRLFERLRQHHAERTSVLGKERWKGETFRQKAIDGYGGTEARRTAALKASTPEVNEKKRQSAIGRKHSEETKRKMSEARRKRFAEDPVYKNKILKGLKQFNKESL